jgi:hypothetical protein
MIRKKLKHATGWVMLGIWFFFGASCTSPDKTAAIRTALDLVHAICPPETTVGDCLARVDAMLAAGQRLVEPNPYVPADAGTE